MVDNIRLFFLTYMLYLGVKVYVYWEEYTVLHRRMFVALYVMFFIAYLTVFHTKLIGV